MIRADLTHAAAAAALRVGTSTLRRWLSKSKVAAPDLEPGHELKKHKAAALESP